MTIIILNFKGDDAMDIPALSSISAQSTAGILMMKKILDASEENGQAMVDLLNTATPSFSPPHLGQTVDISA